MQSLDTFALQQAINTQLEATGTRYGPDTLAEVSRLRSAAVAMRLASESLAEARSTDAITAEMIGQVPYGRVAAGEFGAPRYSIRALITVLEEGQLVPKSIVIEDIDPDAMTVGALREAVDQYVADAADRYSGGLASIDRISIEAA